MLDPSEPLIPYIQRFQSRGEAIGQHEWRDVPFNIVVRAVCEPCNNKWGSQIEDEAKPILMPLLADQPILLDPSQQATLAVWATKTLLMLQLTHRKQQSIPPEWFHWFRQHRWPLPSEQIWIARYDGTGDWPVHYAQYGMSILKQPVADTPHDLNAHAATIGVGHLVFVMFGHMIENGPSVRPMVGTNSAAAMRAIWPALGDAVSFPPAGIVVGNSGLKAMLDAFGDADDFRAAHQ